MTHCDRSHALKATKVAADPSDSRQLKATALVAAGAIAALGIPVLLAIPGGFDRGESALTVVTVADSAA